MIISFFSIFFTSQSLRKIQIPALFFLWIGGAYLDYILWRCPNCGYHLGAMKKIPKACKNCHLPLDAKEKISLKQKRSFKKRDEKEKPQN